MATTRRDSGSHASEACSGLRGEPRRRGRAKLPGRRLWQPARARGPPAPKKAASYGGVRGGGGWFPQGPSGLAQAAAKMASAGLIWARFLAARPTKKGRAPPSAPGSGNGPAAGCELIGRGKHPRRGTNPEVARFAQLAADAFHKLKGAAIHECCGICGVCRCHWIGVVSYGSIVVASASYASYVAPTCAMPVPIPMSCPNVPIPMPQEVLRVWED